MQNIWQVRFPELKLMTFTIAAIIGGTVVGLLCAVLLVMFIVYRMRKKVSLRFCFIFADLPFRFPYMGVTVSKIQNWTIPKGEAHCWWNYSHFGFLCVLYGDTRWEIFQDEGSYALDEPKRSPSHHQYQRASNREFYAWVLRAGNTTQCASATQRPTIIGASSVLWYFSPEFRWCHLFLSFRLREDIKFYWNSVGWNAQRATVLAETLEMRQAMASFDSFESEINEIAKTYKATGLIWKHFNQQIESVVYKFTPLLHRVYTNE